MSGRFTLDGGDKLEAQLMEICARTRRGVLEIVPRRRIKALVLGGGYGRGEGGVLRIDKGEQPYNDLEFYVIIHGPEILAERRLRMPLHELGEKLSAEAGIEVELKLLGMAKLRRSPVSMFYYDLVSGNRLIEGDENWVAGCEHHLAAHRIPLSEATRLLMNRCSGLLFAEERLRRPHFGLDDADFVGRNLAKAKLALGDVILTMRGQYHWSCRERHKRLKKMAAEKSDENLASIVLLHEQGVEFKLHPVRSNRTRPELSAELDFLKESARGLWLRLESRRLEKSYQTIIEYCLDHSSKCPETARWKNCLINLRTYGLRRLTSSIYPRERLLRALPLLLWESGPPETHVVAQRHLLAPTVSWRELVRAYEDLWRQFN